MDDWLIDEEAELLGETLSLLASWDHKPTLATAATRDHAQPRSETKARTATTAAGRRRRKQEDAEQSGSSSSNEARAVALVVAKPKDARRRVNATRERRKQEIEELRGVSVELESQLFALKKRREEMLRPHYSGHAIQSTVPIWESLARRQFQSRRRSEEYNATLRQEIQAQKQVAEGLMNAIQVAMQRQTLKDRRPKLRPAIDVSQRLSEEQQLQRLDYSFPQWQWALSLSPKFQQGELQFVDFKIVTADGKSATLDMYTSRTLPYCVAEVADVTWGMFQQETSGFGEDEEDATIDKYVQEAKTPDDTIIAVFTMDSTMGGATARQGTIHGKWVAKRATIDDGSQRLVNTQWQYELEGFGNELDGVSVLEDTWLRIVDAKDISYTHLTGPLAVLQHVRRLDIQFNRSEPVDSSHIETVTELFMKEIRGELEFADRGLEQALMEQSLKRRL